MIGYYEAPDGENEALFIADYIQKYMRRAGEEQDLPRAAVLYRTNSQSRLVEEALRRYGIAYTMVGGFSFYDRSEIKDLLSYLKLVQNPDDSIALARVINTPARGIGKTTLEILDRLSVETGMSTWGAIEQALKERLLPARACVALATFRRLIEDARALLEPGFAEKLTQDVVPEQEPCARNRCGRVGGCRLRLWRSGAGGRRRRAAAPAADIRRSGESTVAPGRPSGQRRVPQARETRPPSRN